MRDDDIEAPISGALKSETSVILHMGLNKTASSSIQATAHSNRGVLKRYGIHYARFAAGQEKMLIRLLQKRWWAANHSVPLVRALESFDSSKNVAVTNNSRQKLGFSYLGELKNNIDALKPGETLLISGESIGTLPEDKLRLLKWIFDEAKVRQRVILYVRAPFEFFVSLNQQHIKLGLSKGLYCSHRKFWASEQIKQIQGIFPTAEFIPFAVAKRHPDGPAGHFLETIGAPPDQVRIRKVNESLCRQAVELLAYINSRDPAETITGMSRNMRPGDFSAFRYLTGERYGVTEKEIEPFEDYLAEQNKWFRENLGDEFTDKSRRYVCGEATWCARNIPELKKVLKRVNPPIRKIIAEYFEHKAVAPRAVSQNLRGILRR